jgi:NAD(P)H dehydrogenase (quinone)
LPVDDVNVLITFYSRGGLTERIAVWLAEGAVQAGAKIKLRRARDIASEEIISRIPEWKANRDRMHEEFAAPTLVDAEWADVLALGAPASKGLLSPELCAYLDQFRSGELEGKIGTAFTSGYSSLPGRESTSIQLQTAMLALGLTVIPQRLGVSTPTQADEWELAHAQGRNAVALARALKMS